MINNIDVHLNMLRTAAAALEAIIFQKPDEFEKMTPGEIRQLPVWILNRLLDSDILLNYKQAQEYGEFKSRATLYKATRSPIYPCKFIKVGVSAAKGSGRGESRYYFLRAWVDDYNQNKAKAGRPWS